MSRLGKGANRKRPDAVPLDDPRDLPLRLQFGHGAKRHTLSCDRRRDVGIADVVETPPLPFIEPEQHIYLAVAFPKRRYRSA